MALPTTTNRSMSWWQRRTRVGRVGHLPRAHRAASPIAGQRLAPTPHWFCFPRGLGECDVAARLCQQLPHHRGGKDQILTRPKPRGTSKGLGTPQGLLSCARAVAPAPPASVLPQPWWSWVPGWLLNPWVSPPPCHTLLSLLRSLPRKSCRGRLQDVCRRGSRLFLLPQYLRNRFRAARSWASPSHSPSMAAAGGPTSWSGAQATSPAPPGITPGDRPCPYEGTASSRPAGVWHILGTSLGLVFGRSREVGDGNRWMGALCHDPAASSSGSAPQAVAPHEWGRPPGTQPSSAPPGSCTGGTQCGRRWLLVPA